MSETHNQRDIFLGAAEAISKYGWIQGSRGDTEQGFCAIGAIIHSAHQLSSDPNPWHHWAAAVLRLRDALDGAQVSIWNDAQERTAEDVILALKKAAEDE